MKSRTKPIIVLLFALGILFVLLPAAKNPLYVQGANSIESYENKKNLEISAVSGKIHINSNWSAAKAAGICTGKGTYSDPYIIEDFVIDGGGSGSCILIEHSDVYFRIDNCTVNNSGDYPGTGIRLVDVINGELMNNTCSSNYRGIFLEECNYNNISRNEVVNNIGAGIYISDSFYNNISGNTVNNNLYGISLHGSSYNTISRNTANHQYRNIGVGNSGSGIDLDFNSSFNRMTGNIVINNAYDGISIIRSDNNGVFRNNLSYNFNTGMSVYEGNENNISENSANYNSIGIKLWNNAVSYGERLHNNLISGNNATNNTFHGIFLKNCNDHLILGNKASYNTWDGMCLSQCDNNNIMGNTANNNLYGIELSSSNYNSITGNSLIGNNECVREDDCHGNDFSDNGACTYTHENDREPFNFDFSIFILSFSSVLIGCMLLAIALIYRKNRKYKDGTPN